MSDNVLKVFEGLTDRQAKELRRRIIQALPELRREVTEKQNKNRQNGGNQNEHTKPTKEN